MVDLTELFESIPLVSSPEDEFTFNALSIPHFPRHHLGKDGNQAPVLAIATERLAGTRPPSVILENVSVLYDTRCRIRQGGDKNEGHFTVVRCLSSDGTLQKHFLHVLSPLIVLLGPKPSRDEVSRVMNRLIALFRAITEPSKKSVRGIWAELFLINQSSNPELLVRSWRAAPDDQFDFSYGGQRIEVKSSAGRRRVHHFSHEQLHPPQGAQVIVVSLFVERAGAGTSVGELTQSVRDLVAGDAALISHVDQVVFETLGQAWNNALSERFDSQLASQSLSAFSADLIPRFPRELPTGLTDVHFQADLTGIASLEQEMLHSAGGLFAAINPIQ